MPDARPSSEERPEALSDWASHPTLQRAQNTLALTLTRLQAALPNSSQPLQYLALQAVERLIVILNEILSQGSSQGKPYFMFDLSYDLNLQLLEQIFHLSQQARWEEFLFRQLFGLAPDSLEPLPKVLREELAQKLLGRFERAIQAIQVEVQEHGTLRGFSLQEQEQFFEGLREGTIQTQVFPQESEVLLKPELDHDLYHFGQLLKNYLVLAKSPHRAAAPLEIREKQRFDLLIQIYSFPFFLTYQYYRSLLDYVENQRQREKIDLVKEAQHAQTREPQALTGDADLDRLFGNTGNSAFIPWPTGKAPIYGLEQYQTHFLTERTLPHLQQIPQLSVQTSLLALVFDVSGSMLSHDVPPSRFEYALNLQESLVSLLSYEVALAQVVFSSVGIVSHVFGQSKASFLGFLGQSREWFYEARLELVKDMFGLTSLGSGIFSAISLIEQTRDAIGPWNVPPPAEIILFSDGDHNYSPNYYPAAQYAKQLQIPIHTVCCAREICLEMEGEAGSYVMTLHEVVEAEAQERARKWKTWYPETSFQRILRKQRELVLNRYRHRLQQHMQRSTGVYTEPLETISQLSGGHFFHGAFGEQSATSGAEIVELLEARWHLREQLRAAPRASGPRKRQSPKRTKL